MKAKDSEKGDLESENQRESAMVGDSEKVDLESATIKIQEVKARDSKTIRFRI